MPALAVFSKTGHVMILECLLNDIGLMLSSRELGAAIEAWPAGLFGLV